MLEELRWKTSSSATTLHAAVCRREGITAADSELARLLDPAADVLIAELNAAGWPPAALPLLAALATEFDSNRELVARVKTRLNLARGELATARIVGAITDLEAALQRAHPNLADELAVRGRPLREQWEARGPGLLAEAARLADIGVVPTAAEIVLVAPYAGGHGMAHPGQNRVTFEAMLVHPHPHLPETLRLGWLLCQLNSDLPAYADSLPPARRDLVFAAAMVPPLLAAAEELELATCDEAAIESALQAWGLSAELPPDAAGVMWNWWNAWLDRHAAWPVAVAALDQLLRRPAASVG